MDNTEISKILLKNSRTCENFNGVYALNTLPRQGRYGYYVINLDSSYQRGSHWVAIKISRDKSKNIYFDSYGFSPAHVKLIKFLRNNDIFNTRRLQHPLSTTCGQWCIYFIWRSCQGLNFRKMFLPFRENKYLVNDHILNIVMQKHFKIKTKVIDKKFLLHQIAANSRKIIADASKRNRKLQEK